VQLALIALLLRPVVAVGDVQHDAADEGPEQGIDAEFVRERGKGQQDDKAAADAQLGRGPVRRQQCAPHPG
jgi:hypothetical protein